MALQVSLLKKKKSKEREEGLFDHQMTSTDLVNRPKCYIERNIA